MAASVLSVNVGRVAALETGRRTLRSAIDKRPAGAPVLLSETGLAGDEQADPGNHGGVHKAAYAYASEAAAWWSAQLGRPVEPGLVGENLTTAGLDVDGAEIGERWRVGGAEVIVTGPRVPCAKLGARMGDPRFPKRFAAAGRPGAYLRVTRAGEIGAGDVVEVLERPGHGVSVATVFTVVLLERERLGELEPARPWFNPELAEYLDAPG